MEWASKRVSAAERASEASSAEQVNKWTVRANKWTDKRVTHYSNLVIGYLVILAPIQKSPQSWSLSLSKNTLQPFCSLSIQASVGILFYSPITRKNSVLLLALLNASLNRFFLPFLSPPSLSFLSFPFYFLLPFLPLWFRTAWRPSIYYFPWAQEWVSERANKWAQRSAWAKQAVCSQRMSEWCRWMSEHTSEWPCTYIAILISSGP